MSNLSELLPAGAGAKSADFVASGTLGSGVTVALKSDGTVEAVAETQQSQSVGTPVSVTGRASEWQAAVYDSTNNKIVLVWKDTGGSGQGDAVVGTVSGNTISFGSIAREVIGTAANRGYNLAYDSTSGKIIVGYQRDSTSYYEAAVGTISGTSISFGTPVVFSSVSSATVGPYTIQVIYDPSANKTAFIYYSGSGDATRGRAKVGTVSGTSISFGSETTWSSGNVGTNLSVFDTNRNEIVTIFKKNYGTREAFGIVASISGTSISFNSETSFASSNVYGAYQALAYDSENSRFVILYRNSSSEGVYVVATNTGTLSYGTTTQFASANTYNDGQAVYDSVNNAVIISWSPTYAGTGTIRAATVNPATNTLSFGSSIQYQANSLNYQRLAFDSGNGKVCVFYQYVTGSNIGYSVIYQAPYLLSNNTDFIGITDQAIADTATGAVIVQGGVSDKVTGLTANTDYYVQADGSISTTVSSVPAGRALSTTSILLEG